ncbi:hypothetical protein Vadar_002969 [Vaccinium darrowii]|uniref:Uncharacterized protein n=1 Tax=Vaccinium darrowii TaxID=229202 RepID=A0ACB7XX11_9ERIC|nr:hypothetical protein Vadar_002969 [Vaccinium darrowii]
MAATSSSAALSSITLTKGPIISSSSSSSSTYFPLRRRGSHNVNRIFASVSSSVPKEFEQMRRPGPVDLVDSILSKVTQTDRGVLLTSDEHQKVAEMAQELRKFCVDKPVKCPLIFGEWDVVYCSVPTSPGGGYRSAFGRLIFKTNEMIQVIQAPDTVRNKVSFCAFGFFNGEVSLEGKLKVLDDKWIQVIFEPPVLTIGALDFKYGGQSEVKLEITYVDEKIRLGKGSRASLCPIVVLFAFFWSSILVLWINDHGQNLCFSENAWMSLDLYYNLGGIGATTSESPSKDSNKWPRHPTRFDAQNLTRQLAQALANPQNESTQDQITLLKRDLIPNGMLQYAKGDPDVMRIGIDPFPHVDINMVTSNVNKTKRLSSKVERMKQKEDCMEVDGEPYVKRLESYICLKCDKRIKARETMIADKEQKSGFSNVGLRFNTMGSMISRFTMDLS